MIHVDPFVHLHNVNCILLTGFLSSHVELITEDVEDLRTCVKDDGRITLALFYRGFRPR